MIFAISAVALRVRGDTSEANGFAKLMDLTSEYEAIGLATKMVEDHWPKKQGWQHCVRVTSELYRRDPDSSGWLVEKGYEVDWSAQSLAEDNS